ncbi:CLUMA_CG012863, isoform A [Clunio marinus]|uniref:CLUMA_CG012863, isoform A n=1 Tax=Clunio marinus TaxID=568069 RepID=A0A1J1IM50_9DIPT|nr:CLUMA_CG012863, isoform A [Clunio marinus]
MLSASQTGELCRSGTGRDRGNIRPTLFKGAYLILECKKNKRGCCMKQVYSFGAGKRVKRENHETEQPLTKPMTGKVIRMTNLKFMDITSSLFPSF